MADGVMFSPNIDVSTIVISVVLGTPKLTWARFLSFGLGISTYAKVQILRKSAIRGWDHQKHPL
jgi:hypothetical protein